MTLIDDAASALVQAINNPTRAAPLGVLARIKYPGREVQPNVQPDGAIQFVLQKWGFQYKHRGPKPKNPPPANTAAILAVLNTALAPRFVVQNVLDVEKYVIIEMEETT